MTAFNVGFDRDDLGDKPEMVGWPCHVCRRRRTLLQGQPCAVCKRNSSEWGEHDEQEAA